MEKSKNEKVIIAMSGGVDSSVAAAIMKKAGFNVVGVFMRFWQEPRGGSTRINADINPEGKLSASYGAGADLRGYENRCCSSEAEARARKVAKILEIPFYVFNFEKEFKKRIVDYFLEEHKKGLTPNPCVICNKEIKFGLLLKKAMELDADFVATGHYARKREIKSRKLKVKSYQLLKSRDKGKDQSYFLWQLSQEQLKHILFPIGNYTRKEVEKLARKFKLPVLRAKKSVEICFIKTTIEDFLKRYLKEKPGSIVDTKGNVLGKHYGLWFYTIGQRKGICLPHGPYYVLAKDSKKNILIVTKKEKDLEKKELICENVNWISGEEPKLPLKAKVKIRYRHQLASATINWSKVKSQKSKVIEVIFEKPQRAITPGQSVVFYSPAVALAKAGKNQELLGGGIIC